MCVCIVTRALLFQFLVKFDARRAGMLYTGLTNTWASARARTYLILSVDESDITPGAPREIYHVDAGRELFCGSRDKNGVYRNADAKVHCGRGDCRMEPIGAIYSLSVALWFLLSA